MSRYTNLGPGDSETWPAYCGHQNDPRNDDIDAEEYEAAAKADALYGDYFDDDQYYRSL